MAKIIDSPAVVEHRKDLVEYLIEVNRRRQIPDYKDGLKPVHRRILTSMMSKCYEDYVKSALVVGDTMGKYHPHGDTAIYDAMKPMTNSFEAKYPYIDGQGGFGTAFGDSAAAARYTEVRVSKFAKAAFLEEMRRFKEIVDWIPNYDNSLMEPEYFPSALPVLLINGCFGIGVGLKTEVPCHNLGEVVDATLNLLDDPEADVVLIPDQCMPTYIMDTNFKAISNKGHGQVKVRGVIDVEQVDGKTALVIKSTPDMVFLKSIVDKIESLSQNKEIQLYDMYDESDDEHMRYVLVLKKGQDPNYVKDIIYSKTDLEKSINIKCELLNNYEPIRFSYKSYLLAFIEFRKLTKFRSYCNKLQVAQTKLHEKDAYIKALQSGKIDEVLDMIRKQKEINDTNTIERLIKMLGITDLQASYIINAGIKKLSIGYLDRYIQEANELSKEIDTYFAFIHNDNMIVDEIRSELNFFKMTYYQPRLTKVIDAVEDTVPRGTFKIIITDDNFIRKLPETAPVVSNKSSTVKSVIIADNTESIILFDEMGKVYRLPISKIPMSSNNYSGTDVRLLIKNLTSNINTIIYEPLLAKLSSDIQKYFLVMVTANGNIKKMDLDDFANVPLSGLVAFKMDDNDAIRDVKIIHESLDILVYSGQKALRVSMNDIPYQKRNNKGMKSIDSRSTVDGLGIITPDTDTVIVITNNGRINKFSILAIPLSQRTKPGNNIIKLAKGDSIHSIHVCNSHNTLHVVTASDKTDIPIESIQDGSSISNGVKMIPLKNDIIIRTKIKK